MRYLLLILLFVTQISFAKDEMPWLVRLNHGNQLFTVDGHGLWFNFNQRQYVLTVAHLLTGNNLLIKNYLGEESKLKKIIFYQESNDLILFEIDGYKVKSPLDLKYEVSKIVSNDLILRAGSGCEDGTQDMQLGECEVVSAKDKIFFFQSQQKWFCENGCTIKIHNGYFGLSGFPNLDVFSSGEILFLGLADRLNKFTGQAYYTGGKDVFLSLLEGHDKGPEQKWIFNKGMFYKKIDENWYEIDDLYPPVGNANSVDGKTIAFRSHQFGLMNGSQNIIAFKIKNSFVEANKDSFDFLKMNQHNFSIESAKIISLDLAKPIDLYRHRRAEVIASDSNICTVRLDEKNQRLQIELGNNTIPVDLNNKIDNLIWHVHDGYYYKLKNLFFSSMPNANRLNESNDRYAFISKYALNNKDNAGGIACNLK